MRFMARLSLSARFLLLVLLGVLLPLGVVGVAIVNSSRNSGLLLVRGQLDQALEETVLAMGRRWSRNQSALLDLAEHKRVQELLRASEVRDFPAAQRVPTAVELGPDTQTRAALEAAWERVAGFAWLIEVVDLEGNTVLRLPDDLDRARSARSPPAGFLNHNLAVRERFSGEPQGTLRVRFRSDALFEISAIPGGPGGSVVAVVDRRTGIPLTPLPIDPARIEEERFTWGEESWVSVRRDVVDPPVRLVMAAPLGPVTTPFDEAAHRGTLALLLVALGAFVLVTVFSRRLTRSLEGLSSAAAAVAAGDLSARAGESGPPAVRETAAAFNAMSAELRETLDRMSQREALAAVGEFAASLAHEVRNPLTSIRVDLERCGRKVEDDPDAARALAERALAEIDRLNASVTDFLRTARSEGSGLPRADLRRPLEAAVRAAAPRFQERRCTLLFQPPAGPVEVAGDANSLEQLFLNLLLNAAEASPVEGHVQLSVSTDPSEVLVEVQDEGPGIPASEHERIFEPLVTTKGEGTGLGLSIARRIARAHESDIEVESAPGTGATFSVRLPR
jgi:signal transduction histidine kinase